MKLNMVEEKYIEVEGISVIKNSIKRLSEFRMVNNQLEGSIYLDLSYLDVKAEDNFKTIEIPYVIICKDDMTILNVEIKSISLEVTEGQGLNVSYSLDIEYELEETPVIETPSKVTEVEYQKDQEKSNHFKEISEKESEITKEVKDNIKEDYDEMLKDELNRDSVVVTKEDPSEKEFIDLFSNFEQKNCRIRKIKIFSPEDLEKEKEKNQLTEEYLKDNYDNDSGILTIKSYE